MLNWIWEFLQNRMIQVRVGDAYSNGTTIDNGTPQGSIMSPVLFNVMVKDIFEDLGSGFGVSLLADDGAVWKRGRNIKHITSECRMP